MEDLGRDYSKENIQQFFKLPNFIEISGIEHINSFQALARLQSERAETYGHQWPVEHRSRAGFFDGWVQVILILLNLTITLFFILNDQFKDEKKVRSGFWRMVSIPFTALFFVEMCMVIFTTSGTRIIQEKKLYILEIICQIVSIVAYMKMFNPNGPDEAYAQGASMLSFAFLMRNLRISYLLQEVKEFKVIMEMIMKMTVPILFMLCALYLVFYFFAIVGMYGLGGEIRQPNFHSESGIPNNLYYLVNFNDLGQSMVTLYAFMIINNWPAMTDMMVGVSGDVWPRIYFMIFYVFVQWIILNIVIAMMLEIFTNVSAEQEIEFETTKTIHKLMEHQKRLGEHRFEQVCDEINEDIMREEVNKSKLIKRTQEHIRSSAASSSSRSRR